MSGHNPGPWVKYYPSGVPAELVSSFDTMLAAWDHQVAERPLATAVHYFDATITFADIDSAAWSLATVLRREGVCAGDRVAVYLQNDPQWLVTLIAAWRIAAIPVAVNPMLRAAEMVHHLNDSGAAALICLDSLYDSVVSGVLGETSVRVVITTHPLDMTPRLVLPESVARYIHAPRSSPDVLEWHSVVTEDTGRRFEPAALHGNDVGVLTYTSGTTGTSKGAMNLHSAMLHSSDVFTKWWDIRAENDVVLGIAPVFHITGIIAGLGTHILSGAPLILLHRFDPAETLHAIERWKATFTVAASTAYIALSTQPDVSQFDLSSLTKTSSGGAPVSQALVERVSTATGWTIRPVYGLTETTSPTHLSPLDVDPPTDPESGALSVGVPVPGARVRIVDPESGADLDFGKAGEIVIAGPMVIPGYWDRPEDSRHAVRDGWLHTGDVGRMSEDGWLFVVDRLKDLINAGGYKIFPREVEDVLYQHPAVREASVIGVPDEYRGETVKAFVSLIKGAAVTPEELIAFCRERIAAYKYPRIVEVLDELPKTASGKLLRRELRGR